MHAMKKLIITGAAVAGVIGLAACGGGSDTTGTSGEPSTTAPSGAAGEEYSVAVAQIVSHPSLDASIKGFKAALADAGLNVKYDNQNANNDQNVVPTIASAIENSDADLVLAVATPMAQGIAQVVKETPVLFTAVTDPVGAGLVESDEKPGANVTGTSDANPVKEQVSLIKEISPNTKSIGVIYNPGEANSVVQVEWVKEAAEAEGIQVVEAGAVTSADVQQAADSLAVDAIYLPTDNTVISALDSVLAVGEAKGIPVYAAEGDSVEKGALATYGISYYDLGYQTGQMAVRILTEGANPADMPVETQTDLLVYANLAAAERMGVTLPEAVLSRATEETTFSK